MSSAGSGSPASAGPRRPGYAAGQLLASVVVLLLALPLLPLVLFVIAWARCRDRHGRDQHSQHQHSQDRHGRATSA